MGDFYEQRRENKKFLFLSFCISSFLFLGKFFIGLFSSSSSLLASSIDSLMDSVSTLINIFFLKKSLKPADKKHPFGYGKFEAFSGMIQGIFIVILSLSVFIYSFLSFDEGFNNSSSQKEFTFWGFIMVIFSIITPLILSSIMKKQAEKTHSTVMNAEHTHFFSDAVMNTGVLLGLLISYFYSNFLVDSLIGICISLWLILGAKNLLTESFEILVDAELPESIQEEIRKILFEACSKNIIEGWHELRTRRSGAQFHIDVHLEFNEHISLKKAHQLSHTVEEKILKKFPNAVILTHFDYENDL